MTFRSTAGRACGYAYLGIVAVAACGRIGFDPAGDGGLTDVSAVDAPDVHVSLILGAALPNWARAVTRRTDADYVVVGQLASITTIDTIQVPNAGTDDAVVLVYDPTGMIISARSYGTAAFDTGTAVATDPAGNIYIAGTTVGMIDFGGGPLANQNDDAYVASFTSDGAYRWAHLIGGAISIGPAHDASFGVVEHDGVVVVAGGIEGTVDFGGGPTTASAATREGFIAAYNAADGTYQWAHRVGDFGNNETVAVAATADGFYAAGTYQGTPSILGVPVTNQGGFDSFVAALTPSGGTRWVRVFGGTGEDEAVDIVATADEVVTVGHFQGTIDPGSSTTSTGVLEGYAVAYDTSGSYRWTFALDTPACSRLDGITQLAGGGYAVAGSFAGVVATDAGPIGSEGGQDGVVMTLAADGHATWADRFGGGADDHASGIAGDRRGTLLVAGSVGGPLDAMCSDRPTSTIQSFYLTSF